jgi:dihydroflavonol-4-reductase
LRILVTGATGFLGRRLVPQLIKEGHEVTAVVRETSNRNVLPESTKYTIAELCDTEDFENCIGDNEVVIHLAAYFDFYPSDKDLLYKTNINGTVNLMNACVGTGVTRFIYCSTAETIGPVDHPPANEDTELNPSFDYSKSKVQAEERIRSITRDTGLPHIILRPTGIMGEGDLYTAFELIEALNKNEVFALPRSGDKHLMYVYVDDVVDAFTKAITSDKALNETIIICPDEPLSYDELIRFLTEYLGVKAPRFKVPTLLAKIGVGLMSPFKNRKRTTFLWHMKTIQSISEDRWYSNTKAKELLDWSPNTTMKEGLKREINWAYENGYLERRK